jgi:hypothetical protein
MLNSPIWRIAAATGEEPDRVADSLQHLADLGYNFDDIWTLLEATLNSGATVSALASTLPAKEPL